MRRLDLYASTCTTIDLITWCRERGLLAREMLCQVCGQGMQEVDDKCEDGRIWLCRRMRDKVWHQKKVSIRAGSFFSSGGISIRDTIYALYEWSEMTSVERTSFQLRLSKSTVIGLFRGFGHLRQNLWRNDFQNLSVTAALLRSTSAK